MARHDLDHDDDRGHHGSEWRDDDARQHRSSGRGREPSEGREHHFSRFDEAYSQARGASYRDRHPHDSSDRRRSHGWDSDNDYTRPVDWSPSHSGYRNFGSDYTRPADWSPGHSQSRFSGSDAARSGRWQHDTWSMDGPFVGLGPRGYRRSDERIKEDVSEILTRHGRIDARGIDLHVDNGVVTLQGSVDSRNTKRLVEDVVDEVPGVRDVRNELRMDHWDEGPAGPRYADDPTHRAWNDDSAGHMRDYDTERRVSEPSEAQQAASPAEGRFISSSGSEFRERIREHMDVVGSEGEAIGDVKEISNNSFLVDRPMHRDVFVPFGAIRSMSGNRISLSIPASEVDDQGWATPELMGSQTGEPGH